MQNQNHQAKQEKSSYEKHLEDIGWYCSNKWAHDMEYISGNCLGIDYCYAKCKRCGKIQEEIN
jgi:hypothetical protein